MSQNGIDDVPLYSPSILEEIPELVKEIKLNGGVSVRNPGENLLIRPLRSGDFDRGYLELLSQLTKVGDYSKKQFLDTFHLMLSCRDTYYVTVIEDTSLGKVVGTASLIVEQKFIRNCAKAGRLEDVVVSDEYRGRQLGKLIVSAIRLLAEYTGCYKVILSCKDEMIGFYKSIGFTREEGNNTMMTVRLKDMN